ncbi:MAG: hypothetical protein PWQ57_1494 [Desulfovibrionales bacterium]|nr:hypothetical protein [Desulfovibrionales bacterium]
MKKSTLLLIAAALLFATPALADWRSDAPKSIGQCVSMGGCGASSSKTVKTSGPGGSSTSTESTAMTCLQYVRTGKAPAMIVIKTTDEVNFELLEQKMGGASQSIGSGLSLDRAFDLAKTKCSE